MNEKNLAKINKYEKAKSQLREVKNRVSINLRNEKLKDLSEKRIYFIDGKFFDTELELTTYCITNDIFASNFVAYDYIRKFVGKTDIIIKSNIYGTVGLYSALDEDGYYSFKNNVIINEKNAWKYEFGSLKDVYDAFRDRGIVFENDVYAKIVKKYQRILQMSR